MDATEIVPLVTQLKSAVDTRLNAFGEKQALLSAQLLDLEQKGHRKIDGEHSAAPHLDLSPLKAGMEAIRRKQTNRASAQLAMSMKALVNAGDDPDSNHSAWYGAAQRANGPQGTVLKPLRLIEALRSIPVTASSYEYARLSWTGDADVQQGEGATKAELLLDSDLVTARIATVAVFTCVSSQVLDDDTRLQAEIERIMRNLVGGAAETQLVTGSGTGFSIEGLNTLAAEVNDNSDPALERIGAAAVTMENGGFMPDLVIMNPLDWFTQTQRKDSQGRYLFGSPTDPVPPSVYNRPVVTVPGMPANRALIVDRSFVEVLDRQEPSVVISTENRDWWERNLIGIRVELRIGLAVYNVGAVRRVSLDARS